MWKRYLLTIPAGTAMTLGLLFVMQHLIRSGEPVETRPLSAPTLEFVRLEESEVITEDHTPPEPIDPPVAPPPVDPPVIDDFGPTIAVKHDSPEPSGKLIRGPFGGPMTDGPLVAIVRVAPQYPQSLQSRGVEGWATVIFDVEASGMTSNIRLLEASHPSFGKPSIKAAAKFRYKPRVVDGQPVLTRGVTNRFRFEMEI